MITKAMYIARRNTSLRAMDREIGRLMNYANKSTEEIAVEYYESIHGLRATRDKAARKLRELHTVSETAWIGDEATTGVEDAWSELRDAVLTAISTTYCEESRSP